MELRVKPDSSLADQIKEARERANLTQVELAALLGVAPRTVQNWEANDREPRPKHRRAIFAFLNKDEEAA